MKKILLHLRDNKTLTKRRSDIFDKEHNLNVKIETTVDYGTQNLCYKTRPRRLCIHVLFICYILKSYKPPYTIVKTIQILCNLVCNLGVQNILQQKAITWYWKKIKVLLDSFSDMISVKYITCQPVLWNCELFFKII